MITSVELLLKTLNSNRGILESLFEKRNRIVYLHEVLHDVSMEKLQFLEEIEFLDINSDIIELSDKVIDFFEEFLDVNTDISIGDVEELLENLSHFIGSYLNENHFSKKQEFLKKIRRILKKIPTMILKNLKQLSTHVALTYKTQTNFKNKIKELEFYNQKLQRLLMIEKKVTKTLEVEQSFFSSLYDMELLELQKELKFKLRDLRVSLIELQKSVTQYLNKVLEKVSFWQHLIRLKEMSDNYELKEKTNVEHIIKNKMPLIFSNQELTIKTQLNSELIYDNNFAEKVRKLIKNKNLKPAKQIFSGEIEALYFDESKIKKYIINSDKLHKEFLQTNYDLFEYLEFKIFNFEVDFTQRVELFCKMLLEYEHDYEFSQEYKISNGTRYLLVYPNNRTNK